MNIYNLLRVESAVNREVSDKIKRYKQELERWQGKFQAVKHENNQLRSKLYSERNKARAEARRENNKAYVEAKMAEAVGVTRVAEVTVVIEEGTGAEMSSDTGEMLNFSDEYQYS